MDDSILNKIERYLQGNPSTSEITEYLKTLRENMKIMEDKFSKDIIFIFGLMIVFYFLIHSQVSKINLGPIEINDLSKVYIFIPLIMAYKYYEINTVMVMRRITRIIHLELLKKINPSLTVNKLEYYLLPTSIFLSNEVCFQGEKNRFIIALLIIFEILLRFSFMLFEIFSIYYSYYNYRPHTMFFWGLVGTSILISTLGFLTLSKKSKEIQRYNIRSQETP